MGDNNPDFKVSNFQAECRGRRPMAPTDKRRGTYPRHCARKIQAGPPFHHCLSLLWRHRW